MANELHSRFPSIAPGQEVPAICSSNFAPHGKPASHTILLRQIPCALPACCRGKWSRPASSPRLMFLPGRLSLNRLCPLSRMSSINCPRPAGHRIVKCQGEFIPGYKPIINNQNRRPFICINISSPGYGAWVFSKYSARVAYGSAIVSRHFGNGRRFLLQFGHPLGALSTRIGSMSIEATRSHIPNVDISLVSRSLFTSSLLIVAALLLNPGGPWPSPEPLTCELSGQ
ncbi:hypothetical protein E4T56_gene13821 [Termitomyces sp. T112]|nr:hypothetical protein E4T56_gene13821 [Termitomyces sp. T112]